ncbi:MAG: hypothetical protein ATN35_00995 [Epulopiscium sp. Nele67-Bin004]|nr:MAG: hypothetical protein ATN35_00995 [Epulopiscium sp. Nele67-Bin004]
MTPKGRNHASVFDELGVCWIITQTKINISMAGTLLASDCLRKTKQSNHPKITRNLPISSQSQIEEME